MFNTLLTNTHEQNKELIHSWAFSMFDISLTISTMVTIGLVLWWLWEFIDDKREMTFGDAFGGAIVTYIVLGLILYLGTYLVLGILIAFAHTLYIVPLIYYYCTAGVVLSLFTARYARRTHKAIHSHVKDPNAHTDKAEPMKHRYSNSMLDDVAQADPDRVKLHTVGEDVTSSCGNLYKRPINDAERMNKRMGKDFLFTWGIK